MKPLLLFFGLAYLISWLVWLPLYGPAFGLEGLPVFPYHHALGGLGPLLAAFAATAFTAGRTGVRNLWLQCLQATPLPYLLIALLSPFLLGAAALAIDSAANATPLNFRVLAHSREFPAFSLATAFMYNLIFFGFGEEVGWRGFALPRFQIRWNALTAGTILTVFWALWHWPLFFYRPGYLLMDAAGIAGWVFSLWMGSILLSWLYNASRGSVLICAVFHATIDIAFIADFPNPLINSYIGAAISLWAIVVVLVLRPEHLARTQRTTAT